MIARLLLAAAAAAAAATPLVEPLHPLRPLSTAAPVAAMAWLPDGRLAYTRWDQAGTLGFVKEGWPPSQVGKPVPPPSRWGAALAVSRDGRRAATSAPGGKVHLWDLGSTKLLRTLNGGGFEVKSLTFDPTGKLLAMGDYGYNLSVWDAGAGKRLARRIQPNRMNLGQTSLAWSADGKYLVGAGDDHEVSRWKARSLEPDGGFDAFPATSLTTDGAVVAFRDRFGLTLWSPATDVKVVRGPYHDAAFRPGGKELLVTADDGLVGLMDLRRGKVRRSEVPLARDAVAAWSPDGGMVALSNGGKPGVRRYRVD